MIISLQRLFNLHNEQPRHYETKQRVRIIKMASALVHVVWRCLKETGNLLSYRFLSLNIL